MEMKRVAILALAGAAFAQIDTNSSSIPGPTTPAAVNTYSISAISVTNPPTTNTVAASSMPTSFSTNSSRDWTTPADNYSSTSLIASSPVMTVTGTVGMPSQPKTNSTTSTHAGGIGGGGRITPKPTSASATTTGKPLSGDSVVNGVSIGLFLASVTLTALLQM
ncbi:hypothetical protein F4801DRAFT_569279 [Xylaria longipes]|nr:hypothetical protein F4801DRAFT_569279 [Xylaria longipes]